MHCRGLQHMGRADKHNCRRMWNRHGQRKKRLKNSD